jgi:streptomycin 6-kinase
MIPQTLTKTMLELHGERGAEWLAQLPAMLAECAERWSLTVMPPFPNLSYNYVAPAVRADGSDAVLKVGVPNPELTTEIEALRRYDGRGIVRLLEADAGRGWLLLERLTPGIPLSTLEDDERATSIAAQVMRQLWRPAPSEHPFPTVAKWGLGFRRLRAEFNGGTGPFPAALVGRAESLYAELLATSAESMLLHGDLHHDNILSAERQPWLALDPKGLVGEPAYEMGALLRNPYPRLLAWPNLQQILARRLHQLAEELGFDRQRLLGWGLAQAVLSAWWNYEDGVSGWQRGIALAEKFAALDE